jgi:hypothetical protein
VVAALAIGTDSTAHERTVDITTTGRRSGTPQRIETWFYRADDVVYLSGMPGRRGWVANLRAHPDRPHGRVGGVGRAVRCDYASFNEVGPTPERHPPRLPLAKAPPPG